MTSPGWTCRMEKEVKTLGNTLLNVSMNITHRRAGCRIYSRDTRKATKTVDIIGAMAT